MVARDDSMARAPIGALAAEADQPVRLDLPAEHTRLCRWAAERGPTPASPSPLMVYQGRPLPGLRGQLYAPVLQALG
jgi:hypothetical protein